FSEARWERVRLVDCRASSIELPQTKIRGVAFVDCKLDDANLRLAGLQDARFEKCVLTGGEFVAAPLGKRALIATRPPRHRRAPRLPALNGIAALRGAAVSL